MPRLYTSLPYCNMNFVITRFYTFTLGKIRKVPHYPHYPNRINRLLHN